MSINKTTKTNKQTEWSITIPQSTLSPCLATYMICKYPLHAHFEALKARDIPVLELYKHTDEIESDIWDLGINVRVLY
jgi:hypothetical protein